MTQRCLQSETLQIYLCHARLRVHLKIKNIAPSIKALNSTGLEQSTPLFQLQYDEKRFFSISLHNEAKRKLQTTQIFRHDCSDKSHTQSWELTVISTYC